MVIPVDNWFYNTLVPFYNRYCAFPGGKIYHVFPPGNARYLVDRHVRIPFFFPPNSFFFEKKTSVRNEGGYRAVDKGSVMAQPVQIAAAADDEEEFEEFDTDHWPVTEKEDASLWDAEWDNEEVDEEFAKKFQEEQEKMEAEKSARDKSPQIGSGVTEGTE
jgi:26 proteasome complex subunit DSS1